MSRVLNDSDPMIRELAIWALGGVGGDVAVKSLSETLQNGQSWREQALAAVSLGRIGTDRAVARLLQFHKDLEGTQYADYIEVAVIWALGRSGNAQAAPVLAQALAHTSDDVAAVAAWGLAQVSTPAAIASLFDGYWGSDPRIRQRAARGLVQAAIPASSLPRDRRRIDEIRKEIKLVNERDKVFDVEGILKGLSQAASVVTVPRDASAFIRKHAETIAAAAKRAVIARPERVLSDIVSADARLRLGHITGGRANDNEVEAMTAIARELLAEVRPVAANKGPAQTTALTFLAAAGEQADAAAIATLLGDSDREVRAAAALAAGYVGDSTMTKPLRTALADDWYGVRANAAASLGILLKGSKDTGATTQLLPLLDEDFGSVQVAAAQALGRIGSPSAVQPLQERLLSATVPTMVACVYALRQIGGPQADSVLERMQRHPDPRVREAATSK
ncbi:MAG: HEAT repeat domain-containing protein [bacterium]